MLHDELMTENLPENLLVSHEVAQTLKKTLAQLQPDSTVVLVDEHTREYCLPLIAPQSTWHIIEIASGEQNKQLNTLAKIWEELTAFGCSRKSVLVNLGGGVIGDMGGFAAACYKRGIAFINIPTTLLAQVDASIGGKLAVDFQGLKNHIGLFQEAHQVIVHPYFLETLPREEIQSGYAEMIKHGLIYDRSHWETLSSSALDKAVLSKCIAQSIRIKHRVVSQDPTEQGIRKILNFGHSMGHALETYYLSRAPVTHGWGVAMGMILENNIAVQLGLMNNEDYHYIKQHLLSIYTPKPTLPTVEELLPILSQDKKNRKNEFNFSLVTTPGKCLYDIIVKRSNIKKAIETFY